MAKIMLALKDLQKNETFKLQFAWQNIGDD